MPRSRRLWLLLPAVFLTLFLAAFAWHNQSLSNNPEDVWLVLADSFPAAGKGRDVMPAFPGQEEMPNPFAAGQHVVVGLEDDPTQAINDKNFPFKPLSASLIKEIQAHHSSTPIKNIKDRSLLKENEWRLLFGRVEFQDRYTATCSVTWGGGDFQGAQFQLWRSSLPFASSKWQVVSSTPMMITVL